MNHPVKEEELIEVSALSDGEIVDLDEQPYTTVAAEEEVIESPSERSSFYQDPSQNLSISQTLTRQQDLQQPTKKWAHYREKQFICDDCGHGFTMKQNVQNHIFMFHIYRKPNKRKKSSKLQCPYCDKSVYTQKKLDGHINRRHKSDIKCPVCNADFRTTLDLDTHMENIHPDARIWKCNECCVDFGRRTLMETHNRLTHGRTTSESNFPIVTTGLTRALKQEPDEEPKDVEIDVINETPVVERQPYSRRTQSSQPPMSSTGKRPYKRREYSGITNKILKKENACPHCNQEFRRALQLEKHKATCYARMNTMGIECQPVVVVRPGWKHSPLDMDKVNSLRKETNKGVSGREVNANNSKNETKVKQEHMKTVTSERPKNGLVAKDRQSETRVVLTPSVKLLKERREEWMSEPRPKRDTQLHSEEPEEKRRRNQEKKQVRRSERVAMNQCLATSQIKEEVPDKEEEEIDVVGIGSDCKESESSSDETDDSEWEMKRE